MKIIVHDLFEEDYVMLFSGKRIPMTVAAIEFPEHGVRMTLSHREDDPEEMWLADCRINPGGVVVFSHGIGNRDCRKQIAGPEIVEAINKANIERFN